MTLPGEQVYRYSDRRTSFVLEANNNFFALDTHAFCAGGDEHVEMLVQI